MQRIWSFQVKCILLISTDDWRLFTDDSLVSCLVIPCQAFLFLLQQKVLSEEERMRERV